METPEAVTCAVCGAPPADAPRLVVRQQRHLDPECTHEVALCLDHARDLRAGALPPQRILFAWATRCHATIYENVRLILRPLPHCLQCNAPLGDADDLDLVLPGADVPCPACGSVNVLGRALGHHVSVRLRRNGA